MIEQDLLGISVNELIQNYCVLYDEKEEKEIGITTIKNAEKIDKTYGNDYEERYVFVDIFATNLEVIKKGRILSQYEIEKILEEYIGYVPNKEDVELMAALIHQEWVQWSKESTQVLLNLLKVVNKCQGLISEADEAVISETKDYVDEWRKKWCSIWMVSAEEQYQVLVKAKEILKTIHENGDSE